MAFQSTAWCASLHSSANAARGPGSTYDGFQPDQTTTCQTATTSASASSFGQVADHSRAARLRARTGVPRALQDVEPGECVSCHGATPPRAAVR